MTTDAVKQYNTRLKILRSLRGKLTVFFLLVSLIPLIVVGLFAFIQSQNALQTEATNKLIVARDLKANQINMYFQTLLDDVVLTAKFPVIAQAAQEFAQATKQVGGISALRGLGYLSNPGLVNSGKNNAYDLAHAQYVPLFDDIVKTRGYYDMFLVSSAGDVLYTQSKEDDFATNLLEGPYRDSPLAKLFQQLRTETNKDKVILSDFSPYAPSQGAPASFVGSPVIQEGRNVGVLIFQLPMDRIKAMMQDTTGMGKTGETYLVGQDKLMRSDSRFSQESTILKEEINTTGAQEALAEKTGAETYTDYRGSPVLAAYKPIKIGDLKWALIAEIDQEEAFAEAVWLRYIILIIISVAAAVVAVIGFLIARSITTPIQTITHTAARLAVGDVNQSVELQSGDEIGQMANSFRQMITYQQQMAGAAIKLAQGDIAVNVTPQSGQDVLGNAFGRMIIYQQQMSDVANQLALGDVAAAITPQSGQDVLGNAFSRMITYQQQVARAAGQLALGDVTANVTPQSNKDILGHAFKQMISYQQQMAEVADQLAEGDLTADITPQSDQDALGNAFSRMILNLRDLITQVADTASTVGVASSQLATAAEQAGQASQQVAATIQQITQGAAQQTQGVTEAAGNVEQMARASEGIARGAQEQAQGVAKTSDLTVDMTNIVAQVGQTARSVSDANAKVTQAARSGATAVGQTGQGMEAIRVRTLAAADKVKEMGNRSKEIGRIVETIDDIADKTDMLALNAAVEAARAGEYGRGFAVVADQVRKLSEDSKSATRDIGDLIERVQDSIREAVTAMDSTIIEVDNGTRLTGDTVHSLEQILQAAENAASLAEQITTAVAQLKQKSEGVVTAIETVSAVVEENTAVAEEMAASSQEVMQAMEGVAGVAEENSAAAEEVSASAEEMSAQVEEVVASSQELSSLAGQLREAISQFRIEESHTLRVERPNRRRTRAGRSGEEQPLPLAVARSRQSNGQK